VIEVEKSKISEDELLELALEAGASDVSGEGDNYEITSSPDAFEAVRLAVEKKGLPMITAEVSKVPQNFVKLDAKHAEQMIKLYETLDEHDDVQKVYANFDIDDEILEKLSG